MFTGFKVLRSKSEDRKKDNKKSPSKWSLDKALCQGNAEKVKDQSPEPVETKEHGIYNECSSFAGSDVTTSRVVGVPLERDPNIGLGINLRPASNYGLVVTHIKPHGPADREGTIKVGDRVLAVDGKRLGGLNLAEAQNLLTQATSKYTWLVIEYDVSVMSNLRSSGPLLVEIESSGEIKNQIGLSLIDSSNGVIVSKLKTASISERCGAFLPGDQILAVNDVRIENSQIKAIDVSKILDNAKNTLLQIEILPVATSEPHSYDRYQDYNEYQYYKEELNDVKVETGLVTLQIRPGEMYGIVFRSAPSKKGVIICYIEHNSIADRSGVLQVGDRLITANGRPISDRLNRLEDLGNTLHLSVQFDVEVYPRPKESIKTVKLTRSLCSGFGVTITDSPETGIVVSEVRWGSVAHRSGRVFIGDRLVKIDRTRVTDMNVAMRAFKACGEEVTFYLCPEQNDLGYSSPGLPSVDSAVESWDSSLEHANMYAWRDNRQSTTTQHSDDDESIRLSQLEDRRMKIPPPPSPPCPLQTNYNLRKITLPVHWRGSSLNESRLDALDTVQIEKSEISFSTFRPEKIGPHIFQVTLYKSLVFDDFGFSVSDGLYEKGVFINTIKPGSPADLSNSLKQYDKIIKVNDIPTHDLDCCMTVPLMASAGKKLNLTLARYSTLPKIGSNERNFDKNEFFHNPTWVDEVGLEALPDEHTYKKTETI